MTQLQERASDPGEDVVDPVTELVTEPEQGVMGVLRSHVPLSLLMDIARPGGPSSEEIARTEGGDAGWLAGP